MAFAKSYVTWGARGALPLATLFRVVLARRSRAKTTRNLCGRRRTRCIMAFAKSYVIRHKTLRKPCCLNILPYYFQQAVMSIPWLQNRVWYHEDIGFVGWGKPLNGCHQWVCEGTRFPHAPLWRGVCGFFDEVEKPTHPTRMGWHALACMFRRAQTKPTAGETC